MPSFKEFSQKMHPSFLELGNQRYCFRLWTYCANHSSWQIGDNILRHHRHSFVSPLPLQHWRHHGQKFQVDLFKAVQMSARSKISRTYSFRYITNYHDFLLFHISRIIQNNYFFRYP